VMTMDDIVALIKTMKKKKPYFILDTFHSVRVFSIGNT